MKALSLHQPWATLIADGVKTIETRSWSPHRNQIGRRIGIHASRFVAIKRNHIDPETWDEMVRLHGLRWAKEIPKGAMVATAVLKAAYRVRKLEKDRALLVDTERTIPVDPHGDYTPGRWLWVLEDIRPIDPPIPATGRLGLWNWDGGEEFEDTQEPRGPKPPEPPAHQPRLMTM